MMQALVFDQAGEPADVLRLADRARPAQDGHVLVQVAARPIHPADLAFIRGQYRIRPAFPQVAGLEGAGTVIAGPAGTAFGAGSRVAFRWPGSWTEIAAVPLERLIAVPADISDDDASQISLNPITAWGLLEQAAARPEDWIMLSAATSTVANLVAAMARRCGIRVIGLVRGEAEEARARSLAEIILSTRDPDLLAKVAETTDERRIAAFIDSVGGPLVQKLFPALQAGGRIIAYGVQDRAPAEITNAMLIYSNLTWTGFGIDRYLSTLPGPAAARMHDELWAMIRNAVVALPVASRHALGDFSGALAADAQSGRQGKVLLV
jgi:NADPH:quinone reductase-like Zn-dependent oxidoreductase